MGEAANVACMDKMEVAVQVELSPSSNGADGNGIAGSVIVANSTSTVDGVLRTSDRMAEKPAERPTERPAEGPLEVLGRIVAEHPADLYDIPLGDIVDGFMAELNRMFHAGSDERVGVRMESTDLDRLSEFLLLASTLLEWKSRLLLASDDEPELDEELYAPQSLEPDGPDA